MKKLLFICLFVCWRGALFALAPQSSVGKGLEALSQLEFPIDKEMDSDRVDEFIAKLKLEFQHPLDESREKELFSKVAKAVSSFGSGEYFSVDQILTHKKFQCVGCTALSGHIFRELGYTVHWLNVIDNIHYVPEGHAALLVQSKATQKQHLFDVAMMSGKLKDGIFPEIQLDHALNKGERVKYQAITDEREDRARRIWAEKERLKGGNWRETIEEQVNSIHPSFQILEFNEGFACSQRAHETEYAFSTLDDQNQDAPQALEEMLKKIEGGLSINPEDPYMLATKAGILTKQGKYKEAKRELEKGLKLSPNNPLLLNRMGIVYLLGGAAIEANHKMEAVKIFERAFDCNQSFMFNNSILLAFNLTRAYISGNFLDDAKTLLELISKNFLSKLLEVKIRLLIEKYQVSTQTLAQTIGDTDAEGVWPTLNRDYLTMYPAVYKSIFNLFEEKLNLDTETNANAIREHKRDATKLEQYYSWIRKISNSYQVSEAKRLSGSPVNSRVFHYSA